MKKILKLALCAACTMGMVACEKGGTEVTSDKEAAVTTGVTDSAVGYSCVGYYAGIHAFCGDHGEWGAGSEYA